MRTVRRGKRVAISEMMSSLIMIAVTLIAGVGAFGFVNGQVGVSAKAYGNQVAGNINFLNERSSVVFVNFPGVGAADTQITLWIENTGNVALSSYSLIISGLYCSAASDTCGTPANTIAITCTQGGGNCVVTGPVCAGMANTLVSVPIGQTSSFTLTLPAACSITFQATANSPPAPQTVSFTVQFSGNYGSTATSVRNR